MIELQDFSIHSGDFILQGLNLVVPTSSYAVLLGRTGTGKTTLLEIICGLRNPTSGRVLIGGVDMTKLDPADRGIGYVPQDSALFATQTVHEHLSFSLQLRKQPTAEITKRCAELARALEIEHLLHRKPHGLSGGERQRVALGRALAHRPSVLLLDEPLASLDEETRDAMHEVLIRLHQETACTVLHVTHSSLEARRLASCQFELRNGQIKPLQS